MSLRIGVIGAGIMGADHARILDTLVPGADVILISDLDVDRAAAVASAISGCEATGDAWRLIEDPDVDAVLVASSDATHVGYVQACLAARKPVLCEKPLAPTAAECRALVDAEDAATRDSLPLVSVGFMRRFDPGYMELRDAVDSGSLGVPLVVHSVGRGVSAPSGNDELTVTGSAIHDLDIVPWLIRSPVVEVAWLAPRQSPEVADRRDPQFLLLRTEDGVLITVDVFLNARYGYDIRCEVVGSLGTMALTEPARTLRNSSLTRATGYAADWRPRFEDAYRLQNTAWVRSVLDGSPSPLASARDGLQAALVADAAIGSMRIGGGFVGVGAT